jgi:hypothetical protein
LQRAKFFLGLIGDIPSLPARALSLSGGAEAEYAKVFWFFFSKKNMLAST